MNYQRHTSNQVKSMLEKIENGQCFVTISYDLRVSVSMLRLWKAEPDYYMKLYALREEYNRGK